MTDEPQAPPISDADRAILFMIEAGVDLVSYQMDIILRCFEVDRE